MPNMWAHKICAEVTLRRLGGSPAADLIKKKLESYRLGCQGADIMYFRLTQLIKGKNGVVYYARLLHKQPLEKLVNISRRYLADACSEKQFADMFAYICGFLCHHSVDLKIHNMIYAKDASLLEHRRIELDLDAFMTRELNIQHDRSNTGWMGMGEFTEFAGLAQWYNYIFHDLDNKKFSMSSYIKDYKAMRLASAFLDRPYRRKNVEKSLLPLQELRTLMNFSLISCVNTANTINKMYHELEMDAQLMSRAGRVWQQSQAAI